MWAGTELSVQRLATGSKVRGSNPGGGEIFRIRPDGPCGSSSLLYNGYWFSFPGVKRPGRGVDHQPQSSAEVKERVDLYLYSPSGSSWPVLGRTLSLLYKYSYSFRSMLPLSLEICARGLLFAQQAGRVPRLF
jgi:hypothetical protein